MKLQDIGFIFFGFYKHFTDFKFDFTKTKYVLPKRLHKEALIYTTQNQYVLRNFMVFSKQNIIMFAILNQLKYRQGKNILTETHDDDLKWFYHTIQYYKNDFIKDIDLLYNEINSIEDVYKYHITKKINWYSMYYIMTLINVDKSFVTNNDILQQELKRIHKAVMIFRFDKEFMKESVKKLEKKLKLINI